MRERQESHSQGRRQWKQTGVMRPGVKESEQPLEAENIKEIDYPLRDSTKKSSLLTRWLHPTEPDFRFLTSRTVKEYSLESLKKRDRIFKNPADFQFLHVYHPTSSKPVSVCLIAELSMDMFDFSPRWQICGKQEPFWADSRSYV